MNSIVGSCCKT